MRSKCSEYALKIYQNKGEITAKTTNNGLYGDVLNMSLFVDKTSGRYIKLSQTHGWHKVDEITKIGKNAQGKLIVHKKDGRQLTIVDDVENRLEDVLKKEGKDITREVLKRPWITL